MRGSRPEDDALFVEIQSRRELPDERHSEEHQSEYRFSDEEVNVMGLRGSGPYAVYAMAIHGRRAFQNCLNQFRSNPVALAEAELLRDEIGDHAICRACVEKGVGAGCLASKPEFDVPDHDQSARRAGDAGFAWNWRPGHDQRMKAGSSSSSGMDHVM